MLLLFVLVLWMFMFPDADFVVVVFICKQSFKYQVDFQEKQNNNVS